MRDIDSIPNPHEREPEEPRTGTRHEQAVVDVGKSLYPYNDPLDAEGIVIEILSDEDGDIYEVINYAVAQRERVLELEQENAELRQERDQARAKVAKARKDALEEAAKACDRIEDSVQERAGNRPYNETQAAHSECAALCALSIRALAAKDAQEGK